MPRHASFTPSFAGATGSDATAPIERRRSGAWRLSVCLLAAALAREGAATEPWTLDRAISCALTNGPDARLAQHRIASAEAAIQEANAAFWPRLQFGSSYTGSDNPMNVFGWALNQRAFSTAMDFNHPPTADDMNVRGQVTVPLYSGGRNVAGRRAATANVEASRQEAFAVRNALEFEVARAYFTVVKAGQFIHAAEAAVHAYETNRAIASRRFDGGTILKTELLDVEVRLAQAREDLVRARNMKALAEHALGNLLGLENTPVTVAEALPELAVPGTSDFSRRPELRATHERQRAKEAEVRRAQAGYLPRLNAFGSYDRDEGWEFRGAGRSWTAGLLLQWDIWDGRLTAARVQGARADLDTARETDRKTRLAIELEVEQARLNLEAASERLGVTEKAVAQARESTALTRVRFDQGLALATQLIDAETALTTARVRRVEALADQRIAVAALRKALALPQLSSPPTPP